MRVVVVIKLMLICVTTTATLDLLVVPSVSFRINLAELVVTNYVANLPASVMVEPIYV